MRSMRLESTISGGADSSDHVRFKADLARALVPEMRRCGVATVDEVDIETLAGRMLDEVIASGSVIVGHSEIGACSRT